MRAYTLEEIANLIDGEVVLPGSAGAGKSASVSESPAPDELLDEQAAELVDGLAGGGITGLAPLADAGPNQLAHLSSQAYKAALPATRAGAVLLQPVDLPRCPVPAIVVANPYWAYARLTQLFEAKPEVGGLAGVFSSAASSEQAAAIVAPSASVDAGAQLEKGVGVGAGACIGAGATLGKGVIVHANAVIGANCTLGEHVEIHAGAVLADGVSVGAGSTIHANAVIGSEGFGYAPDPQGVLERIAQLGSVIIGKNVSVGAGTTVDRGALGNTRIGDGVKIDNQVQIGHNCDIGNHSVICGCCGIVGSTTIGAHCVLGGGVGVGGDGPITLCDGVTVSGMTHVSRSIGKPGVYSGGVLHSESRRWKRNALRFADLDGIAKRLATLEKRLDSSSLD